MSAFPERVRSFLVLTFDGFARSCYNQEEFTR
jgi:hypothetical protein